MASEEQIRDLAHAIWQAEGYPEGKHLDHYFRAKQMLEQREKVLASIDKMRPHPDSRPIGGSSPNTKRVR